MGVGVGVGGRRARIIFFPSWCPISGPGGSIGPLEFLAAAQNTLGICLVQLGTPCRGEYSWKRRAGVWLWHRPPQAL